MREVLVVQTGQCGNQVGSEFWRTLLKEHVGSSQTFSVPMSTFFRNFDEGSVQLGLNSRVNRLKANAVLVDMEEGVLNATLASDIGGIFDDSLLISGVSGRGSGNNFGEGYTEHGNDYGGRIIELMRGVFEKCDSPQGILLLSSLGGGTGSGLGSRLTELTRESFENMSIIAAPVIPSRTANDVITSPYNSVFSLASLADSADIVIPFDNEAIGACISSLGEKKLNPDKTSSARHATAYTAQADPSGKLRRPFREINMVITSSLSCMTSSMRYGGDSNVDLNELSVNLVPFPDLNFVCTSLSPLPVAPPPRNFTTAIKSLFGTGNQLLLYDTSQKCVNLSLASAILARGSSIDSGMLGSAVESVLKAGYIRHPEWGSQGFKVGISSGRPAHTQYDAVCLRNSPQIVSSLNHVKGSFNKLYSRKMYLHHYDKYLERSDIERRSEIVDSLIASYNDIAKSNGMRTAIDFEAAPIIC